MYTTSMRLAAASKSIPARLIPYYYIYYLHYTMLFCIYVLYKCILYVYCLYCMLIPYYYSLQEPPIIQ